MAAVDLPQGEGALISLVVASCVIDSSDLMPMTNKMGNNQSGSFFGIGRYFGQRNHLLKKRRVFGYVMA